MCRVETPNYTAGFPFTIDFVIRRAIFASNNLCDSSSGAAALTQFMPRCHGNKWFPPLCGGGTHGHARCYIRRAYCRREPLMHDSCLDAAGARVTASAAIPIPTVCFTYLAYNDRQADYNKPYARARCKDRTGNYNKPFGAPFWFVKFLSVKSPLRDALFIFPVAT